MRYIRPLMMGAALVTVAAAAPASAQGVYVGAGPVGVGVDTDHRWRQRHHWRGDYASDCRVTRERIVTPSGRVIYKTRRICD